MRLLVCGDRDWTDREYLYRVLDEVHRLRPLRTLIEGEARGADRMSREWGIDRGVTVLRFPALWFLYRQGAGPLRNQQMLDQGQPDIVLAFHNNLSRSTGTRDMLERTIDAGIPWVCATNEKS